MSYNTEVLEDCTLILNACTLRFTPLAGLLTYQVFCLFVHFEVRKDMSCLPRQECGARDLRDKTMGDKLMYISNDDTQITPSVD